MGNIVTGSGSGEPSHPSVLSHEGVHSEKDRLTTRSLNTSLNTSRLMLASQHLGVARVICHMHAGGRCAQPTQMVSGACAVGWARARTARALAIDRYMPPLHRS